MILLETISLVLAGMYWTDEAGDTYLLHSNFIVVVLYLSPRHIGLEIKEFICYLWPRTKLCIVFGLVCRYYGVKYWCLGCSLEACK